MLRHSTISPNKTKAIRDFSSLNGAEWVRAAGVILSPQTPADRAGLTSQVLRVQTLTRQMKRLLLAGVQYTVCIFWRKRRVGVEENDKNTSFETVLIISQLWPRPHEIRSYKYCGKFINKWWKCAFLLKIGPTAVQIFTSTVNKLMKNISLPVCVMNEKPPSQYHVLLQSVLEEAFRSLKSVKVPKLHCKNIPK